MHVLMIADFYAPYLGGVEQHVRTLSRALAEKGHEVHVATLGGGDLAVEEMDGAVSVHRIGATVQRLTRLFSSDERTWAPPIPDPEATIAIARLVRRVRPDVVHGHDWLARSYLPLHPWASRRFGTRLVTSLHYFTQSCPKKDLIHVVAHDALPARHPCEGPSLRRCVACTSVHYGKVKGSITTFGTLMGSSVEKRASDSTISVSAATAEANGHDRRSVTVIGNPVPLPGSGVDEPMTQHEERLSRLPDGDFILFVGDLRPMKGVDVLLDAYGLLRTAGPVPPLVLIGKHWPDTPSLDRPGVLVEDRWPNRAVLEAWRRSSIAVVPSVWAEPFGIVVVEAMAGGSPVVASAVGGIPEIVRHECEGLLVSPGDAAALASAIGRLIDDPAWRLTLGRNAQRRANDYGSSRIVAEVLAVYDGPSV